MFDKSGNLIENLKEKAPNACTWIPPELEIRTKILDAVTDCHCRVMKWYTWIFSKLPPARII